MMKTISLLSFLLTPLSEVKVENKSFLCADNNISFSRVWINRNLLCTYKNIPAAQLWIDKQSNPYDKSKHCAVSCYLTLRCRPDQVRAVGLLKEFRDLFGYGNAEVADIKANFYGVNLAQKKIATRDEDCSRICSENFRP